jgi:hypothetical protein
MAHCKGFSYTAAGTLLQNGLQLLQQLGASCRWDCLVFTVIDPLQKPRPASLS